MILFQNRPAWRIESDQIRVSVMQSGAHVAETTWKRSGVNPLWIQNRPTIDSDQFDPAIHAHLYGDNSESRLLCGLLGHNLCLPWWGPPSDSEFAAGMTFHGESNIVRWQEVLHEPDRLLLAVNLPNSRLKVKRSLRCSGAVLHFDTSVENLSAWDRPLAWCEHVTLGIPFLSAGQTGFFADLARGFETSRNAAETFDWPSGQGQIERDLSRFSAAPHSDLVNSFLVDTSAEHACFVAWNAPLRLAFGYVFRSRDFPWMNIWENHDDRSTARGMEFSTTPIEGSMKALFSTPTLLGRPTFEWLDAKATIRKQFFSFSIEVPNDFAGAQAVSYNGSTLRIDELGVSRSFDLLIA